MKKRRRFKCDKCDERFINAGLLAIHTKRSHPTPPPHIPVVTYERDGVPNDMDEELTLLSDDTKLPEVGDVFYHVRKFVVLHTTRKRIDGVLQKEVTVKAKCTKRHWQPNKPQ